MPGTGPQPASQEASLAPTRVRCPRCDAPIGGDYKFCPSSAYPLRTSGDDKAQTARPPRSTWRTWFLVAAVSTVIIASALVGILLFHPTLFQAAAPDVVATGPPVLASLAEPAIRVDDIPAGSRIAEIDVLLEREPYAFDRRFLLRVLTMGHSQFAEYVGARGPNTHVNVACASTASGIALAEDWIRAGRCRRVVVVAADNVTSDALIEWFGAGFIASGAGATDERVEDAALPFDRRRHGTLIGMGACALVVESQDAVEERGMRGIVELLSAETRNSAFHATRLDVEHVASVMESLVASAERRLGVDRTVMAPRTVFVSHETYTPARGGSAAAEIMALREVFGPAADRVIIANTKGFTGHPMGVGVEDVIAVKILEHQIVPPVPNLKEPGPELGNLTLSKGGRYDVEYAIHLAACFGWRASVVAPRLDCASVAEGACS